MPARIRHLLTTRKCFRIIFGVSPSSECRADFLVAPSVDSTPAGEEDCKQSRDRGHRPFEDPQANQHLRRELPGDGIAGKTNEIDSDSAQELSHSRRRLRRKCPGPVEDALLATSGGQFVFVGDVGEHRHHRDTEHATEEDRRTDIECEITDPAGQVLSS